MGFDLKKNKSKLKLCVRLSKGGREEVNTQRCSVRARILINVSQCSSHFSVQPLRGDKQREVFLPNDLLCKPRSSSLWIGCTITRCAVGALDSF